MNKNKNIVLVSDTENNLYKSVICADNAATVPIEKPIIQRVIPSDFSKTNFINSLSCWFSFLNMFLINVNGLSNIFINLDS